MSKAIFKKQSLFKNAKGYTLIELVVTFALTGIFMTAAVTAILAFMQTYTRVTGIARAQIISDILSQRIIKEVSAASKRNNAEAVIIGDNRISFQNRDGQMLTLKSKDGYLKQEYESRENSNNYDNDEMNWYYGKESYMGTTITRLHFEQVKNGLLPTNKIRMTLELTYQQTGYSYEMKRVFPCYNLTAADVYDYS